MRYLFAAQARGEIPKGTAEKFVKETPKAKLKRLPEREGKSSKLPRVKTK
jgi:hypothetical protein